MNRCKLCVMPEVKPHIILDKNGVCNLCSKNEKIKGEEKLNDINLLIKKINKYKSTDSRYDCAVSVSGGKDSIMTLYIAKKILNLNPLAIFIDNGFACDEMYSNVKNATDILKVDLEIFKTSKVKELFKYLLEQKKPIYYCRVCHALIDLNIREICAKNNISLILGGYTKGQNYLKNFELHWIYKMSDENTKELLADNEEFKFISDLFPNIAAYFSKKFKPMIQISPFWYIKWDESEIISTISKELKFKSPNKSWPANSTNCLFNYVSQYLSRKYFGYSQHEAENSYLVRNGELNRERALEIINTPITNEDLSTVLEKLDLKLENII